MWTRQWHWCSIFIPTVLVTSWHYSVFFLVHTYMSAHMYIYIRIQHTMYGHVCTYKNRYLLDVTKPQKQYPNNELWKHWFDTAASLPNKATSKPLSSGAPANALCDAAWTHQKNTQIPRDIKKHQEAQFGWLQLMNMLLGHDIWKKNILGLVLFEVNLIWSVIVVAWIFWDEDVRRLLLASRQMLVPLCAWVTLPNNLIQLYNFVERLDPLSVRQGHMFSEARVSSGKQIHGISRGWTFHMHKQLRLLLYVVPSNTQTLSNS